MVSSINSSLTSLASSLFSQLDTSNKGYLEESDLSTAFSSLLSTGSSSSDTASNLFSSMDSNQDGKVTEDELATTLQSALDQLNAQYDSGRMAGAMGQMPPPPPPADGGQEDAGLTEDEMSSIASTTTDSKLADLLNNVSSNFSAADTNGDGKVTRTEAMAYQQSTESSTNSSTNSTSTTSGTADSSDALFTRRILELLQAYGQSLDSGSNSTLSLSA